ncbi:MAG: ABC transporter ATP-binding protein [Eubacteriaceae bacterium]|jgi:ATP-binding cassette subfamily B multidrug efflux pump
MLKTVSPFLKKYKWPSILAPLTIIVEVLLEIQIPFMMAKIVDIGVANRDLPYIINMGWVMVGLACGSLVFGMLSGTFAAKGAVGFGNEVRVGVFNKIQDFSFSNIDHFSTPSLITRLTTDITNVQMSYMMIIRVLVRAPVMLISAAMMASAINGDLTKVFLVSIPLLVVFLGIILSRAYPRFNRMLRRTDDLNADVQENLTGIRVVKAFNRQAFEKKKFHTANTNLTEALVKAQDLIISIMPVMMLIMNGTILYVLWNGGFMIIGGTLLTGELISFLTYCTQILTSLMMIAAVFMTIVLSFSSLKRICEVLDEPVEITNNDAESALKVKDGSVTFDNVSFKYDLSGTNYVLENIDLKIQSGETIGIIGGTGSAKSTLVQLIPRLYQATEGTVMVGGNPVQDYTLEHLRDSVSMVLQQNVLFSGTIASNLRWGNEDATDAQLMQACKDASIDDYIKELPDGLQTELGQSGVNLSGGQKQRLCIARALLKQPKIIILDDSTSAVDMATDKKIRESFKTNLKGMTTIIVAQRISTIEDADKVVILDDGKVNAFASPAELAATNPIYQDIMNSQKKGVEA